MQCSALQGNIEATASNSHTSAEKCIHTAPDTCLRTTKGTQATAEHAVREATAAKNPAPAGARAPSGTMSTKTAAARGSRELRERGCRLS